MYPLQICKKISKKIHWLGLIISLDVHIEILYDKYKHVIILYYLDDLLWQVWLKISIFF